MMMLKLIGLQLKVNFNLSALKWYFKHDFKRFAGPLGLVVMVIVGIAPIFFLYLMLVEASYDILLPLGQTEVVLASALVLASLLVLLFGLAFVMSVFYFSRDLSLLVPLPLQPRDILGSKFLVVLLYDYLTVTPFFLPALWVYGVNTGAGVLYWVLGGIVFLLVPVIPLALASLLILVLMRFTNLSRRRDTLRLIGFFLLLAALLAMNFFISSIPLGEEAEFLENILLDEDGLISLTTRAYPPALYAARALTAGGRESLLNLLSYLGISAAGIILVLFVGQGMFYQGLIGGAEIQRGRVLSREDLARKTAGTSSPEWAIVIREIKILIRTPIYLINSLATAALVLIILLIPMFTGGGQISYYQGLAKMEPRVVPILGAAGLIGLLSLFAPAASSSFSREGRLIWVSRVIPVAPQKQIRGKVLYAMLVSSLALPVMALILVLLLNWSLMDTVLALAAGLILTFPAVTSNLLIDLLRPYLAWDSEQKAIKQNINVLLGLAAGVGIYYLLFLAGKAAYGLTAAERPVYLVVLGGAALLGAVFYAAMLLLAPQRYRDLGG